MSDKRVTYLSWDESFMWMAKVIAKRSKDPVSQMGAVVVDRENIVLGMGYNGFPKCPDNDETFPWSKVGKYEDTKYAYVVHAEANAILNCSCPPRGAKLYCVRFPCNECAKLIIQAGITEVIFLTDECHDEPAYEASRFMLDKAQLPYRQLLLTNDLPMI